MADLNILFTSAGRRVSLLRSFRRALDELALPGSIIAADAGLSAAATFVADEKAQVPRIDHDGYIDALLELCDAKSVRALVSLVDTDLVLLSENAQRFEQLGTTPLVCSAATNRICFDKVSTHAFFTDNDIRTPQVLSDAETEGLSSDDFPVMVKPWDGSGSAGVHVAANAQELAFYRDTTPNAMVQRLVVGDEYTCDAYVDFSGTVRCVVPRRRLETRAGEVSKGLTVRDPVIIDAVTDCVDKLPHAVGCMTVQCFKTRDGSVEFIEVNPRFGGGHPLTIHAGANFPKWILQELTTGQCDASFDCWTDDLVMLRYDAEVITQGSLIR